jgi:hypothetical protein
MTRSYSVSTLIAMCRMDLRVIKVDTERVVKRQLPVVARGWAKRYE